GVEGANGAFEYAELLAAFMQTGDVLKLAEIAGAVPSVLLYANSDDDEYLDPAGMQIGTGGITEPVYLDMDGFLVRGQGQLEFNFLNALTIAGSVAVELGPVQNLTLANGRTVEANTLTIGAANVSALVGYVPDGKYWDDANGNNEVDAGELDSNAVGVAITDLDIGLALFASIQVTDPLDAGIYLAGTADVSDDPNVTTDGIALVGVPGVTASGSFGIDINLGLGLAGLSAVDFRESFPGETAALDTNKDGNVDAADNFDEAVGAEIFDAIAGTDGEITYEDLLAYYDATANGGNADGLLRFGNANAAANDNGLPAALLLADRDGDGTIDAPGFQVNTGNADAPVFLDFEQSLLNFEAVGLIEIANPLAPGATIARADGLFLFNVAEVDLPAGGTSLQLSVLAQASLAYGPDVSAGNDFFRNEITGALVLNAQGIAADIQATTSLGADLGIVDLGSASISSRIILNTTSQLQRIAIPERFESVIDKVAGPNNPIQFDEATQRYYYVIQPNAPPKEEPNILSGSGTSTTVTYPNAPYLVVTFDASLQILDNIAFDGSFRIAAIIDPSSGFAQFELSTDADLVFVTTFGSGGSEIFRIAGAFDLRVGTDIFSIRAAGQLNIGLLGSIGARGELTVSQATGIVANLFVTGQLGSDSLGIKVTGSGGFSINTKAQIYAFGFNNVSVSIAGGLASATGAVNVVYNGANDSFEMSLNVLAKIGGDTLEFNITAGVGIYTDGILLGAAVNFDLNVLGLFDLDLDGRLIINTTDRFYDGATQSLVALDGTSTPVSIRLQ
ncbi:MAG: hypothetical protein OEW59_09285, partial [Gammaproteobacteria bacterium]|nr:hypothetical protein [Gammaproteobacteria bacterium]